MNAIEPKDTRRKILDCAQAIVGQKGFSAVGINEVLKAAGVPKGSFYHYFSSKDAFGEALLDDYFASYAEEMDKAFSAADRSSREKLIGYWLQWIANQSDDSQCGKCLAVKLGAEVADLSELMRLALKRGTSSIIQRLASALEFGVAEGSLSLSRPPRQVATRLYQLWLGASIMAKITRSTEPFDDALDETERVLKRLH